MLKFIARDRPWMTSRSNGQVYPHPHTHHYSSYSESLNTVVKTTWPSPPRAIIYGRPPRLKQNLVLWVQPWIVVQKSSTKITLVTKKMTREESSRKTFLPLKIRLRKFLVFMSGKSLFLTSLHFGSRHFLCWQLEVRSVFFNPFLVAAHNMTLGKLTAPLTG